MDKGLLGIRIEFGQVVLRMTREEALDLADCLDDDDAVAKELRDAANSLLGPEDE